MSELLHEPAPDYRREAAMWWLLVDEAQEYSELLSHMLWGSSHAEFDPIWHKFESLAGMKFGRRLKCLKCDGERRFLRLGPRTECAIWGCAKCGQQVSAFGPKGYAWRAMGESAHSTAYPSHGIARDKRYDAIQEWLRDPELDAAQRRVIVALWFSSAHNFDAAWKTFAERAGEMYPAPRACSSCANTGMHFWRPRGMHSGALWRCSECDAIAQVDDNWAKAEEILREVGASDDDINRVKQAAQSENVAPLDAVQHVLQFNQQNHVRSALPPPGHCFKCGEMEWVLESVSPNVKAAKWKCLYCGRIELVTSVSDSVPRAPARDAISREVQREVWRRDVGTCQRCGSREKLEFDHIIPVSRGGSSTVRNIQLLCAICNNVKSDSEPGTV